MNVPINYLAVFIAGVISMAIGFVWYSPVLFGKQWMKYMGINEKNMKDMKTGMAKIYGISFVSTLIMAYVLAHANVFAGSYTNTTGVSLGLMSGFWNWIGFIAPIQLTEWLFGKKPFGLFLINTSYQLVSILAMGILLALWI